MLTEAKKTKVRGDLDRRWMSDEYFDLIVWYRRRNLIHGFQLCYGKPRWERALTWLVDRGFTHMKVDTGEGPDEYPAMWNATPILLPDGYFPGDEVTREFRERSIALPRSLRNFVLAKLKQFVAEQKA